MRFLALASKATGFPHRARFQTAGRRPLTMDEIPYWRDGTLEKSTPSGDYVGIKFARWAFEKFKGVQDKLGIPMTESGMASTIEEAIAVANRIGYPLMVRPSYVLGGGGMEVILDEEMLREYVAAAVDVTPDRPGCD